MRHALWLIPADPVHARCAEWIDTFARELATPRFAPHVTLRHGVESDGSGLVAAARALAARTPPLAVELGALRALPEYHRALFIEVSGPALHDLHARAASALGMSPSTDFVPHLSLLYGEVAPATKDALVARIGRTLDGPATLDRLQVVCTDGPAPTWTTRAEVALGGA